MNNNIKILLYHGVTKTKSFGIENYNSKHISEKNFYEQMKFLKKNFNIIPMDEIVYLNKKKIPFPKKTVTISFDDGFENNLTVAAPILKRHGMPANFYVTSGFIEENGMSWIDQIELCLECFSPNRLAMPWRHEPYEMGDVESEKLFLDDVRKHVKRDKGSVSSEIVQIIYDQCDEGVITSSDDPLDQKMTWAQVSELADYPLFTVGGHTHTHAILGYLNRVDMKAEIDASVEMLKSKAVESPLMLWELNAKLALA